MSSDCERVIVKVQGGSKMVHDGIAMNVAVSTNVLTLAADRTPPSASSKDAGVILIVGSEGPSGTTRPERDWWNPQGSL